jgi:hypothetical protein
MKENVMNDYMNIKGRKEEENNPELFIFLNYSSSFHSSD